MKLSSYLVLFLAFGIYGSEAHSATTCNQSNFTFSGSTAFASTTMTNSTTASITIAGNSSGGLRSCNPSWGKEVYFVDTSSDLSTSQSYSLGNYYYFKIKSLNGATSGDAATQFLIDHTYIAFSINDPIGSNISPQQSINQNAVSSGINILTARGQYYNGTGSGIMSVGLKMSNVQLYFDALPNLDTIIDALATKEITLDLGNPRISMATPTSNNPNSNPGGSSYTNFNGLRVKLTFKGIKFDKPTCIVPNQTVKLGAVTTANFINSQTANTSQNFDLSLECGGYLNERDFTLTLSDNNDINNTNKIGYLKNKVGSTYSNVGVKITDSVNNSVPIGESIDFLLNQSGTKFSKAFKASYYLPSGNATLGLVEAQATIDIGYK